MMVSKILKFKTQTDLKNKISIISFIPLLIISERKHVRTSLERNHDK